MKLALASLAALAVAFCALHQTEMTPEAQAERSTRTMHCGDVVTCLVRHARAFETTKKIHMHATA